MDNYRFFVEFFASKFWANQCEQNSHEEDNDGLGRIRDGRGEGDGGGKNKGGAIGKILNQGKREASKEWAIDLEDLATE